MIEIPVLLSKTRDVTNVTFGSVTKAYIFLFANRGVVKTPHLQDVVQNNNTEIVTLVTNVYSKTSKVTIWRSKK
jgi:hypothetical protein